MNVFPKLFSSYPCFHGALLVLAGLQVERLCKSRHRSDRTDKSTHTGIYTLHTDKDKDTHTRKYTVTKTKGHTHTLDHLTWSVMWEASKSTPTALSLASFDKYWRQLWWLLSSLSFSSEVLFHSSLAWADLLLAGTHHRQPCFRHPHFPFHPNLFFDPFPQAADRMVPGPTWRSAGPDCGCFEASRTEAKRLGAELNQSQNWIFMNNKE